MKKILFTSLIFIAIFCLFSFNIFADDIKEPDDFTLTEGSILTFNFTNKDFLDNLTWVSITKTGGGDSIYSYYDFDDIVNNNSLVLDAPLENGMYALTVNSNGYNQLFKEFSIEHSTIKDIPAFTTSFSDDGDLLITSEDTNFINALLYDCSQNNSYTIKGVVDDVSLIPSSYFSGYSDPSFFKISNDRYGENVFVKQNDNTAEFNLSNNTFYSNYIFRGFKYNVTIKAHGYRESEPFTVSDFVNGVTCVSDLTTEINDDYFYVYSSKSDYLNNIYQSSFISKHYSSSDLQIQPELASDSSYIRYSLSSLDLDNSSDKYYLTLNGFDKYPSINILINPLIPDDLNIHFDTELGDLLIESNDSSFINLIYNQTSNYNNPRLTITDELDNRIWSFSNYITGDNYVNYDFEKVDDNTLKISNDNLINSGICNGKQRAYLNIYFNNYSESSRKFDIIFSKCNKAAPSDAELSFDEETGFFIVTSSNQEWLNSIKGIKSANDMNKRAFHVLVFDGYAFIDAGTEIFDENSTYDLCVQTTNNYRWNVEPKCNKIFRDVEVTNYPILKTTPYFEVYTDDSNLIIESDNEEWLNALTKINSNSNESILVNGLNTFDRYGYTGIALYPDNYVYNTTKMTLIRNTSSDTPLVKNGNKVCVSKDVLIDANIYNETPYAVMPISIGYRYDSYGKDVVFDFALDLNDSGNVSFIENTKLKFTFDNPEYFNSITYAYFYADNAGLLYDIAIDDSNADYENLTIELEHTLENGKYFVDFASLVGFKSNGISISVENSPLKDCPDFNISYDEDDGDLIITSQDIDFIDGLLYDYGDNFDGRAIVGEIHDHNLNFDNCDDNYKYFAGCNSQRARNSFVKINDNTVKFALSNPNYGTASGQIARGVKYDVTIKANGYKRSEPFVVDNFVNGAKFVPEITTIFQDGYFFVYSDDQDWIDEIEYGLDWQCNVRDAYWNTNVSVHGAKMTDRDFNYLMFDLNNVPFNDDTMFYLNVWSQNYVQPRIPINLSEHQVHYHDQFNCFNYSNPFVFYGTRVFELFDLYHPGYTFDGWYLDDNYNNRVTVLDSLIYDNDIDLYSKWELNKYTVNLRSVTKSGNTTSSSVGQLSGLPIGGKVTHGESYTFTAEGNDVYEFAYWQVDGVKQPETSNTLTRCFTSNSVVEAVFTFKGEKQTRITVYGDKPFKVLVNSVSSDSQYDSSLEKYVFDRGVESLSDIELVYEDGDFSGWLNDSNMTVSLNRNYQFKAFVDCNYYLRTIEKGEDNEYYAEFRNSSNSLISAGLFSDLDSFNDYVPTISPSKLGYDFVSWMLPNGKTIDNVNDISEITSLADSNKCIRLVPKFKQKSTTVTLNVVNVLDGTYESPISSTYKIGETIRIKANSVNGLNFQYWADKVDEDLIKLSTNDSYTIHSTSDRTIYAVYSSEDATDKEATLVVSGIGTEESNKIWFELTRSVPDDSNFTLYEHGFIYTTFDFSSYETSEILDAMKFYDVSSNETDGFALKPNLKKMLGASSSKSSGAVYHLRVGDKKSLDVYMRGYMIVNNDIIYTDVYKASFNDLLNNNYTVIK